MTEMSRGDMMRRLDGASKDILKRLANGPLADGRPGGLARALAGLIPVDARELRAADDGGAATNIVAHLGGEEPGESPDRAAASATPD
jgi:hypothetical protein